MKEVIGEVKRESDRCRKLMIGVLATQIQDYLYAKEIADNIEREYLKSIKRGLKKSGAELRRTAALSRGVRAMTYIFDNSNGSENYVFGFKFICRYIGLDPERFRTAIRALRMDTIRAIRDEIKTY